VTKQEHEGWTVVWIEEHGQISLRIAAGCYPVTVAAVFPYQLIVEFHYTLWTAAVFCFVAYKATDPKPN